MLKEFQAFINRGNVIDLAVAVVLGAAFTAIVTSLVENIITPIIGLLMGGVDFSGLAFVVGEATLGYGAFIQAIIDFLIIAFVVFMIVKGVNKAQDRLSKEEEEKAAAAPPKDIQLLSEIRDLLKNNA